MTHFEDGSAYTYDPDADPILVCAGWLARGHAYREAAVPDGFVDRLAWLCVNQLDRVYRGIHVCELCPEASADYVSVVCQGKKHLLGNAEITVAAVVRTYAAPNLILHYVAAHGYSPPDDFVVAAMAGAHEHRLKNWSLFVGPYWDE